MIAALLGRVAGSAVARAGAAEAGASEVGSMVSNISNVHGALSKKQQEGASIPAAGLLGAVGTILGGEGPKANYPSPPS